MSGAVDAPDWKSELVELLRFGDDAVSFDSERPYLIARGAKRVRKFETGLGDEEYRRCLRPLRYVGPEPSEEERRAALERLAGVATRILDLEPEAHCVHVDVVINAKELASLPLEAANGPDGAPLFVGREPALEITRRVRGEFRDRTPDWPVTPNVLFIASSPEREIPLEEHREALHRALTPWIEPLRGFPELDPVAPDPRPVLTVCEQATLESVTEAVKAAKRPFTHVHILCHGLEIAEGEDRQYGLELGGGGPGRRGVGVTAQQLLTALSGGGERKPPTVVTVTACDSGNVGSRISSAPSVADALHRSGIPVVVASQFPLTADGSTLLVDAFYAALLRGLDVREAIHRARSALHERQEETKHDWLSLVAYVQLPEGYQDRLLDIRLGSDLAALRTAQGWADHTFMHSRSGPRDYGRVAELLEGRIESLLRWEQESGRTGRQDLLVESRGLLGSAYKRLAELYFRRARLDADDWLARSRLALEDATDWYGRAFADNLSAHWVAVQQLSLEAVLTGRISQPWRWHAAMYAARRGTPDPDDDIWQRGSRLELHLLAPYADQPRQLDDARRALDELQAMVPPGKSDFIESTRRQLIRYVDWWTTDNGYFPGTDDLAADAAALIPPEWCSGRRSPS